jgi:hypothetical protein
MATPEEKRAAAIAAFNQSLSELHATNPQGLGAGRYQDKIVRDSLLPASQRPGYKPGPERTYINKNKEQSFIQQFAENLGSVTANPFTASSIAAATTPTEFVDDASVGTPTSKMADAVIGTNPQGLGPPSMYNDGYGASFTPAQGTGLEPGGKLSDLSWQNLPLIDVTSNRTAATTGFTPDTVAEGPHEDEPTYAYDPVPGRNLGILDASKGSFYDAYMAPQTTGSKAMGFLGSLIGPALPARGLATWAARKAAGDKPSGVGALGQGDRFANLMAAQHYADQGPEGWVQSDFVGNYNPLEGPMGYGNRMGSIDQEEAHTQEGIDRAGGYDIGAVIGDYLGGMFSGEENNDDGNDEGGWLGRLF